MYLTSRKTGLKSVPSSQGCARHQKEFDTANGLFPPDQVVLFSILCRVMSHSSLYNVIQNPKDLFLCVPATRANSGKQWLDTKGKKVRYGRSILQSVGAQCRVTRE